MLAEIEQALEHHELIKVKIATEDRETKALILEAIVRETGACNVQVIGKTLVLYRPTKERKISLPRKIILKLHTFAVAKGRGVFRRQESKMPRSVR